MIQHFTAYTINCVCHSIRSMFRVLGINNFVHDKKAGNGRMGTGNGKGGIYHIR